MLDQTLLNDGSVASLRGGEGGLEFRAVFVALASREFALQIAEAVQRLVGGGAVTREGRREVGELLLPERVDRLVGADPFGGDLGG